MNTVIFMLFLAQSIRVSLGFVHIKSPLLVRKSCTLYMMSDSAEVWATAKLMVNRKEADGYRAVELGVTDNIAQGYINPGQFVKLKIGDGKPNFFAIASPPDGRTTLSFLVKETPNNDFILNAKEGDSFDISEAQGKGFQIDEYFDRYKNDFPTNNVIMMTCGTGIAPIMSAIDSGKLKLKTTSFTSLFSRKGILYLGVRTPKCIPFTSKLEEWKSQGIEVIPVISRPDDPDSKGWTGRTGYIQDALREDKVQIPRNSGALLCGMRDMTDNVKELLLEAGVFEGRILLNF